jgi:hypothetical protein
MTSRERVHAALQKKPADRVPVFMWFHPETTRLLASALGIRTCDVDAVLGNDVRQAWVGNNSAMEGITHEHDGETHTDVWGITWVKEGSFNQTLRSPLAGADESDLRQYTFPPETPLANIFSIFAAAGVSTEEIRDRAATLGLR